MRSFLLALLPGMAVAALAGQDLPRAAEVSYGYAGPLKSPVWQVGSECYVPIEATKVWGWVVTLQQFSAKVEAEGRTVKVPYRVQAGKEVLPLSQIVKQLGASAAWKPGSGTFEVWSVPTRIEVSEEGVEFDAPFPIKVRYSHLSEPARTVIDLHGARLDSRSEIELPADARISQFKPDVVRIVFETDLHVQESPDLLKPQRGLSIKLGEAKPTAIPENTIEISKDTGQGEPPSLPYDLQPPAPAKPQPLAGPLLVSEEGPIVCFAKVPLSMPLSAAPRISRVEPNVLRLVLPGAKYLPLEVGLEYKGAIEKVEAEHYDHAVAVNITLSRPMGLEMSYGPNEIRLTLIKPEVGNGKLAGKTIVVDAGHGGHDSGARSPDKSATEKVLTLRIATKVASMLAAEGATVIMTRKTDVFIPLKERSEIANRNGADFFISCHINSNRNANSTSGTITFHHNQDPIGILLAECIQRELAKTAKLPSIGVWSDQRIYSSGFAVLRYAKMPAVLLELGFINHRTDRGRMTSATYPEDVARAVAKGLKVFLGDVKE